MTLTEQSPVFGMLRNRSRDGSSSLDYNSDTWPVVLYRDRSDWCFRIPVTWLVRGCSVMLMTCTHVQSRHDDSVALMCGHGTVMTNPPFFPILLRVDDSLSKHFSSSSY